MRLDINLATRPYEDARLFWMRWGLGVGVLGLVTLLLLTMTVRGWVQAGRDRHAINQLEQQISERNRERVNALEYLNLPGNHSMRDQSQYLNGLIQRKAFSWTSVFEDLERVVPPGLHVVALTPQWNDQNQLLLQMKVSSTSRENALELVHRMDNSTRFHDTQLVEEGSSSGTPGIEAQIVAVYVPGQPEGGTK